MLEQRVRSEVLSETMVVLNGNRYEPIWIWLKLLGWCFGNNYATTCLYDVGRIWVMLYWLKMEWYIHGKYKIKQS